MDHELDIPEFLSRKTHPELNKREPIAATMAPTTAATESTEVVSGWVRVYLTNRLPHCSLPPGYHDVQLINKGWKWVKFHHKRSTRCTRIPRMTWNRITGGK